MRSEITGLIEGDRTVIKSIYEEHLESVVSWIKRNNGGHQDGLDVFQEALTQLLLSAKRGKLDHVESFSSYFRGTCKFIWLGKIKNEQRLTELKNEYGKSESLSFIQDWESGEQLRIVKIFLERNKEKLSDTCKRLLTLIGNEVKPIQIAQQLKMSNANTVYRRKFACFKKWRELIESDPMYHQWKSAEYEH